MHLPEKADGDSCGLVFVWHEYQGVMLAKWDEVKANSFNLFWMRIRDGTGEWIAATERKPTQADGDAYSCVLALSIYDGIKITGYHQLLWNAEFTHWQRLPCPPA